jgi:hypothetical protein
MILAGRSVGDWRTWYTDRLSTSEKLAITLLKEHNTYLVGTVKNQKKATQFGGIESTKLAERGQWIWSARSLAKDTGRNNDAIHCIQWHDVKPNLLILSTAAPPVQGQVMRRVIGEEKKVAISAPSVSAFAPIFAPGI